MWQRKTRRWMKPVEERDQKMKGTAREDKVAQLEHILDEEKLMKVEKIIVFTVGRSSARRRMGPK